MTMWNNRDDYRCHCPQCEGFEPEVVYNPDYYIEILEGLNSEEQEAEEIFHEQAGRADEITETLWFEDEDTRND